MMLKDDTIMVVNFVSYNKIILSSCGSSCFAVQDEVFTIVVVEVSTLHKGASKADVVNMGILHDGVNMTVCVDVSITVDTTSCGLSTVMSSVNRVVTFF